ncbi:MAG TPA: ATP-binding protein, partial [Blastocatellia bacterium]|nr:ATP-binding protein [Blastocatellia bacterium]
RIDRVLSTEQATWDVGLLLFLERSGYPEETYHTFSYSPLRDDEGHVVGMLCVVSEDTTQVIGERRMATLRDLGSDPSVARTEEESLAFAHRQLGKNPRDLPFTLTYLFDDNGDARLAGMTGISAGHPVAPALLPADGASVWPVQAAARGESTFVDLVGAPYTDLPTGSWSEPPVKSFVVPLMEQGGTSSGFMVAALNRYRPINERNTGFVALVAAYIAAGIGSARSYLTQQRRADELAELDRAKTTFFSNISHEFRTPLTLILDPVAELRGRSTGLDDQVRQDLDVVWRNGLRLTKLVNTLLDFSRIEAGRAQAVYEPIDLAAYTAELAGMFRSAVEKAGLQLVIDCPPLPEPVFVDRDMWEKVVLNLISNAFKFTEKGEIRVSLRAENGAAVLSIRDTGSGIPEAELPNLFNRFHRVEGARGRTHEGTGIGLALVQELAKLHGGIVTVGSVYGKGSDFIVAIPLGKNHLPADRIGGARTTASTAFSVNPFVEEALRWLPDADSASKSNDATGSAGRSKVVLADDNADMRGYVQRLLSSDYDCIAVADGQEALRATTEHKVDLVLTDMMMPNLDGFGLLKALREDPKTASIPVIMLSARAGEDARIEGLESGADDYLIKPFSARELLARVKGTLALSKFHTEVARRDEELQRLVLELKENDRRKDEFLATLAHELRNPLAPIRNSLQIMKLADDNRNAVEQARETMERQLQQMVRLIDDLLDLSRISRGTIELRKQRGDLAAVVQNAIETSRPVIEQSGHLLMTSIPAEPIFVDADVTRLAQVFANLLNNAAKYTEKGGRIWLAVERAGNEVVVSVKDTGVGIPAHQLPRVFEMFSQVDRSLEKSQGGLGIGLSIVKRLVEMHGGTVEAQSEGHGFGSQFIVRLPVLASLDHESQPPSKREEQASASAERRIVVADDNEDSAYTMAMMLKIMGNDVRTAHDGFEAIEVAEAFRPELILLDIGMPRLNGYDACRQIREQSWGKDVVMVALTGWGQDEDKRLSREAGFDHHLVKPIEPEALEKLLAALPTKTY